MSTEGHAKGIPMQFSGCQKDSEPPSLHGLEVSAPFFSVYRLSFLSPKIDLLSNPLRRTLEKCKNQMRIESMHSMVKCGGMP